MYTYSRTYINDITLWSRSPGPGVGRTVRLETKANGKQKKINNR